MSGATTAGRPPLGTAETRVVRAIALGFLPGGVIFGLLAAGSIAAQWSFYPPAWSIATITAVVVSAIVMGSVSLLAPIRLIRALAMVSAIGVLLASLTLPLVVQPSPGWSQPYLQLLGALGIIASVIAWRASICVAMCVVMSVLTVVDRTAATTTSVLPTAVNDGLYLLLFTMTFVGLGIATRQLARDSEVAESDALRAAMQAAAETVREREHARVNALVHDRVLATLLDAARGTPGTASMGQQDAARALADLRALLTDDLPAVALPGEALAWALQASTTEIAPEALFNYELHSPCIVPSHAVEALTAALEEALRNSMQHAGDANRTVHVQVDADCVQVDVLDDGAGFDLSRIPPERLGISESIRGRMAALPGGDATVIAAPGVGTRVRLRYRVLVGVGADGADGLHPAHAEPRRGGGRRP